MAELEAGAQRIRDTPQGDCSRNYPLSLGAAISARGRRTGGTASNSLSGFGEMMELRVKRLAIAAGYHLTVIALGAVAVFVGSKFGASALADAGEMLLLFHLITFRRISIDQLFVELVLRTLRCSQCQLQIGLVQNLRCGCGFVSSERHVFSPCPSCCKGFAWFSCPRCGIGVLI